MTVTDEMIESALKSIDGIARGIAGLDPQEVRSIANEAVLELREAYDPARGRFQDFAFQCIRRVLWRQARRSQREVPVDPAGPGMDYCAIGRPGVDAGLNEVEARMLWNQMVQCVLLTHREGEALRALRRWVWDHDRSDWDSMPYHVRSRLRKKLRQYIRSRT